MSKASPTRPSKRAVAKSTWAPGATALADAALAVHRVTVEGRSADEALAPFETSPQRAAIRAIALGTIRWYLRLAPAVDRLLSRPRALASDIRALLIVSAHQIEYSRNVAQTTVHAAVDAARILRQKRASGLVNAVLRRFVAERGALLEGVDRDLATRAAHPAWLVEAIRRAWPEESAGILAANNEHPPMVLRVDLSRQSVSGYLADLVAAGMAGHALEWSPAAVRLEHPVTVSALPGFREGIVSVQDAGAQLAAILLDAQPGMRVLDACAAPGGKTGHILERTPDLAELVAVDIDAQRVVRIQENLDRLRRKARLVAADVRQPSAFWDGRPFDRILVDAPCSSTGVIRRHPDIKLLRRPDDIAAFAAVQLEIVTACLGMLAPGGRLLYCTCSILPEENERVLARLADGAQCVQIGAISRREPLVPGVIERAPGIQLLPGSEAGTDGFYYACVEKTTPGS